MSRVSSVVQVSALSPVSGSISPTFTGPFASGQAVTITYRSINGIVVLEFAAIAAAAAALANATATAAVPAALRPLATVTAYPAVVSNSVTLNQIGLCEIATTGTINIYADPLKTGLFSAIGNNGWLRFVAQYVI